MQCLISIIKIKLRENIHFRFLKSFTNNTIKLQLNQNTITNRLIIPCLATAGLNSVNGKLYYDTVYLSLYLYYNAWK